MSDSNITRERMNYDLVIVGAGPAGLSAAIHFKKLCKKNNKDFSVCIVEKGSEVGAHILSGAILEPTALNELIEEWEKDDNCPVKTAVTKEHVNFLTDSSAYSIPKFFLPPVMHNNGNYIISLGKKSSCKNGFDKKLDTLDTTVNAFTRLWLGVLPASSLQLSEKLTGNNELILKLDKAFASLPKPHTDWDF